MEYAYFIDTTYEDQKNPIFIYLDHIGYGLEDQFGIGSDETSFVI